VFNCLAYVALTVRSIQLVLGSIQELTEDCRNVESAVMQNCVASVTDCRNICPEKLEKNEIEQCLDRSLYLPFQGQLSILVTLWILLFVSMIEGFLENLTKLPMPIWKFHEEVQDENCGTALNEASSA